MKTFNLLLLTIFSAVISVSAFAQTYTMNNGSNGTFSVTSGTFVDGGGPVGDYQANQFSVITFCPAVAGNKVEVNFTTFDLEVSGLTGDCLDYLDVWMGSAMIGAPLTTYCGSLNAFSILSTSSNGCLTFRFTSGSSGQLPGWEASVLSTKPCTSPTASMITTAVSQCPAIATNSGSPTVSFDASASTSSSGTSISAYVWSWGDGTSSITATPATTHNYPTPGIYEATVKVRDNNFDVVSTGCESAPSTKRIITVTPTPGKTGASRRVVDLDQNTCATLTGVEVPSTLLDYQPLQKSGPGGLVPDGSSNLQSPVTFTNFLSGATVTAGCYPTVQFTIDHSYTGDLLIELVAPNGQAVTLFNRVGNYNFGACTPTTDGIVGCPATYTVVNSGGLLWSNPLALGTATTKCPGYGSTCNGGSYFLAGTYTSSSPFTTLNGATLNGAWKLRLTDNFPTDDGYLNNWTLSFPASCYAPSQATTSSYSSLAWSSDGTGPAVPAQTPVTSSVSNTGCATVPACTGTKYASTINLCTFSALGNYDYYYTTSDNFGCQFKDTVTVAVTSCDPKPGIIGGNQSLCMSGDPVAFSSIQDPYNGAGKTWSYQWQQSVGCTGTWTNIAGATGITYDAPTVASTTCYRRQASNLCNDGIPSWSNELTVTINPQVIPTHPTIGPYCSASAIPALPALSTNGITGTWSPSIDNTANTTYTFTPDPGQCATTTARTVAITTRTVPTFTLGSTACKEVAPAPLPTTSNNGYKGTWSPAAINNTVTGTTTYIFTPEAGQCATTYNRNIAVSSAIPAFTQAGPYCSGATIPALPTTSTNSVTGTWSPAINNTATTTYTFTPTAGQCAETTTMTLTIQPTVIQVPSYSTCSGTGVVLTATGATSYTWSPGTGLSATTGASVTATPTSTRTYTINGTTPEGCSASTTATVTVAAALTPLVSPAAPTICAGSSVTLTATGGSTYTWSPATGLSATTGTSVVANPTSTTTYTITATNGSCTGTTTVVVTVTPLTAPTFTAISSVCQGATPPTLPSASTNGYSGTWSPAVSTLAAGTKNYTFTPNAGQCATTGTLGITCTASPASTFATVPSVCKGATAPTLSGTSLEGFAGSWSPAAITTTAAGTTNYTFTPTSGQCARTTVLNYTVTPLIVPTFTAIPTVCKNAASPTLPGTSTNSINGNWSPATIITTTAGTFTFTFTPTAGQCANTTTISVTIATAVAPTFAVVPAKCQGSTPPVLPATSTNGYAGTWSPAVSTAAAGTSTYTFTPNAGVCALTASLSITVNAPVTPTFNAIAPVCQNATAPTLVTPSTNSINGIWSPAITSTATPGTKTHTYTPNTGQCATSATLSITVNPSIIPVFAPLSPICQGSTAPPLPSPTNTPAISGTWSPSVIGTAVPGTYTNAFTFTPTSGGCTVTTTLSSVTIVAPVTPAFAVIPPLCNGSTAPTLPGSSTDSPAITGTWSPATISTATDGTFTFTFTPDAGLCAAATSISVTVGPPGTPAFTAPAAQCQNSVFALPSTSNNGIPGTWSPTVSTATVGTATYTFTPGAGQCATTTSLMVTVTAPIIPAFNAISPICQGATAPALQSSSNNGVSGAWTPSTVDNTASGTYTFTPTAGQCATNATLNVIVNPLLVPDFAPIPAICQGGTAPTLPSSCPNAVSGTWNPATVSNTTTMIYTFTPGGGQCATTFSQTVTVNPMVTPTFNAVGPYCQGAAIPALPMASTNSPAITGTWNPVINNMVTTTYTFTPTAGQCAANATMAIVINTPVVPVFPALGGACKGDPSPVLPGSSGNSPAIPGSWMPATISTATAGTFCCTFTPNAGQCATTATNCMTIYAPQVPAFTIMPSLCQGASAPVLPSSSNDLPAITGTWVPATISTATTGTYCNTFTPSPGQCATTTTSCVTVNAPVTPTFTAIPPLCVGAASPSLASNSNNGIPGTWNPATISTATAGTFTFTFTPNATQCATSATLSVTVGPQVTPTFTAIPILCQGVTPPVLPTTSNNSVPGNWMPTTISTATAGTYTFTFTPSAGACAATTTLTVTVNPVVTPTFAAIPGICQGGPAPSLPANSNNIPAITGTWSPAVPDNTTPGTSCSTFTPATGTCATTATSCITVNPPVVPTFNAIGSLCKNDPAPVLPGSSTNSPAITGTWSPTTISTATAGTFCATFTPASGECATTATNCVTINAPVVTVFNALPAVCVGSAAPVLSTNSDNSPSISGTWAPFGFSTASAGTMCCTFTPAAGQCATTATSCLTVTAPVTPTFTAIPALCQGTTPPVLSTTSNNSINGSWSPSTISTATAGTYTFTFTPSVGICATTITLTVTVNPVVTPTFAAIPGICLGGPAPALPGSSNNIPAISGTWNPATISTATAGIFCATFTPTAGTCATTATNCITINVPVVPTFTVISPLCKNDPAPVLPGSSNNSPAITGTWNPTSVSTATAGTFCHTFTPTVGQCATTTTNCITITPPVVPTFNAIPPFCVGDPSPTLPANSNNGITGTWNPATISTATPGISAYTFTPSTGECATTATMSVTGGPQATPIFTAISPVCLGSTPPVLPTTSANGITGSWSPMVSTATAGTFTYTFTPGAGQCATTASLSITVTAPVTPSFAAIASYCQGDFIPALPLSSTDVPAVTGTWSPVIDNTATASYTFTPDAGQCANPASVTLVINVPVVPTFASIPSICEGTAAPALPTISGNGIPGSWTPPVIDNTISGTYLFVPGAGQCATTASLAVTVDPLMVPVFAALTPICAGDVAPVLPSMSMNSIPGTWNPTVSNSATGTYVFTPDPGICAGTASLTLTVNPLPVVDVPSLSTCSGVPIVLIASGADTYTWSPATDLSATTGTSVTATVSVSATYTVTGTSVAGCVGSTATTVTVGSGLSVSVNPSAPVICQGESVSLTGNGATIYNWSPATDLNVTTGTTVIANPTVTTTYTVQGETSGCFGSATVVVTVNTPAVSDFTAIPGICEGSVPPTLPGTSNNGISGTWNPPVIDNMTSGTYLFTPAIGQCGTTASLAVTVNPSVIPTFTQVGPFCQGTAITPLPTVSVNGIPGTWSQAINNTATTTYIFTPGAGQCATTASMTIVITNSVTPAFDPVAPICKGDFLSPLPTISNNGITGTWSPVINNLASTIYTFTPNAGQCATTTLLLIIVTSPTIPTFAPIANVCEGSTIAPLPTNSINGISGVWSPAVDNTATTVYTFTPDAGQCATAATTTITVDAIPVIVVTPSAPVICAGESVQLEATGATVYNWSDPSGTLNTTIDAIVVASPVVTSTYTVTGTMNGCTSTKDVTVTVSTPSTPTFMTVSPVCAGAPIAALPVSSVDATPITGTWSPVIDNTTTTTYTFTPDAGQCATAATITIVVNPAVVPAFTNVGPFCQGTVIAALPASSTNSPAITGGWSPAIDNTVTTTYTFTPDAGQCAAAATMTIVINPATVPTFTAITPICKGKTAPALPPVSGNGISGNWNPSVISTANVGTFNYVFTPTPGQCAKMASLNVQIDACLGLEENQALTFDLYPNPTNGVFTIVMTTAEAQTLSVFDAAGRLVKTINTTGEQTTVDLSTFENGMYLVKLGDHIQRLVKQ